MSTIERLPNISKQASRIYDAQSFMTQYEDITTGGDSVRTTQINQQYITPEINFDKIYSEYTDKQKKFEHLRAAVKVQSGDTVKQELETLKSKIETLKKI